jgi:F-type H+-transporting ATPase subunit delta
VTNRTAATRYARALLDVAIAEHADLSRIEVELTGFSTLFRQHPELEKVLLNPAVPTPRKTSAVGELLKRAGYLPQVSKLLTLLAARDRLVLLGDLVSAYQARLMELRNVVRAEVVTATPLAPERATAIEASLARATGRTVTLTTKVDPGIVGGMVARIAGTVFDASITTQLQRLKGRLLPEGH